MREIIFKKSKEEIKILKEGGRIVAEILSILKTHIRPGVIPKELDKIAEDLIKKFGAFPAFKGYSPQPTLEPFPATICISKNWVVVHGIPDKTPLKRGDIVSIDLGILYKGLYTDAAITVGVGKLEPRHKKLIKITKEALFYGIQKAKPGNTIGDIGYAIQNLVEKNGFSVIKELVGHGVGYFIHESPPVPNFGSPKSGITLEEGMVIAIEPMVCEGGGEIEMLSDGSFITKDRSFAAHFEHTVAITKRGPLILTKKD
jgi:methionyl aminopeptidase